MSFDDTKFTVVVCVEYTTHPAAGQVLQGTLIPKYTFLPPFFYGKPPNAGRNARAKSGAGQNKPDPRPPSDNSPPMYYSSSNNLSMSYLT